MTTELEQDRQDVLSAIDRLALTGGIDEEQTTALKAMFASIAGPLACVTMCTHCGYKAHELTGNRIVLTDVYVQRYLVPVMNMTCPMCQSTHTFQCMIDRADYFAGETRAVIVTEEVQTSDTQPLEL